MIISALSLVKPIEKTSGARQDSFQELRHRKKTAITYHIQKLISYLTFKIFFCRAFFLSALLMPNPQSLGECLAQALNKNVLNEERVNGHCDAWC